MIVAERPTTVQATPMLLAQRARTLADVHDSVCWAKRQAMVCSTCANLNARAARLEGLSNVAAE